MKKKVEVPDTIMSDAEIDAIADGYAPISDPKRRKQASNDGKGARRLPNGEIDWDRIFGIKKRKPVEVSDEVLSDEEIDKLAE